MKKFILNLLIILFINNAYSQEDSGYSPFGVTVFITPVDLALSNKTTYLFEEYSASALETFSLGINAHQRISYKTYINAGFLYANIVAIQMPDNKYVTSNFEIPLTISYYLNEDYKRKQRSTIPSGIVLSLGGYYSFNNQFITEFGKSTENGSNFGGQFHFGLGFGKIKLELIVKHDLTSYINKEVADVKRTRIGIGFSFPIISKE